MVSLAGVNGPTAYMHSTMKQQFGGLIQGTVGTKNPLLLPGAGFFFSNGAERR